MQISKCMIMYVIEKSIVSEVSGAQLAVVGLSCAPTGVGKKNNCQKQKTEIRNKNIYNEKHKKKNRANIMSCPFLFSLPE